MSVKSHFCKNLTEFYQISPKILPNLTDSSSQLMACMSEACPNIKSNYNPLNKVSADPGHFLVQQSDLGQHCFDTHNMPFHKDTHKNTV